ncbi:MAG: HIT domain-containing protein, partial [Deltaproteobacteria bacterium]
MSDCLFCGVIKGDVKGSIVYQDNSVVAFKDINPKAPVHLLIVPRKHIVTLLDLQQEDKSLIGDIFSVANQLAKDQGIAKDGFRVV